MREIVEKNILDFVNLDIIDDEIMSYGYERGKEKGLTDRYIELEEASYKERKEVVELLYSHLRNSLSEVLPKIELMDQVKSVYENAIKDHLEAVVASCFKEKKDGRITWVRLVKVRLNSWIEKQCNYWKLTENASEGFSKKIFGDMLKSIEEEKSRLAKHILDLDKDCAWGIVAELFSDRYVDKNNIEESLVELAKSQLLEKKV